MEWGKRGGRKGERGKGGMKEEGKGECFEEGKWREGQTSLLFKHRDQVALSH